MKKVILILITICTISFVGYTISANMDYSYTGISNPTKNLGSHDINSNFFTQVDSEEGMDLDQEISNQQDFLQNHNYSGKSNQISSEDIGFTKVAETQELILYVYKDTMAIAITDKSTGYTWFSNNQAQEDMDLTGIVIAGIESGVSIEYYNSHSSIVSGNNKTTFTEGKRVNSRLVTNEISYVDYKINNEKVGFTASIDFVNYGISFDVEVYLDGGQLVVNVPYETVKEKTVGTEISPEKYLLRSISLFPYLGSEDYNINGYSFLPDGSGSLVRFTEEVGTSSFVSPIYGNDEAYYTKPESEAHLTDPYNITLPIYGMSHGYNQQAFLAQVTNGYGQAELHSYPYLYSNIELDRTHFKFILRHDTNFNLSSGQVMIINESIYQNDCTVKYDFLSNDKANYVGMADTYRETLNLSKKDESETIPLHLDVLAMDFKPGLFGKNFIELTNHNQLKEISNDLLSKEIENISFNYFGSNKNGYYTKTSDFAKYGTAVGSKNSLEKLSNYMEENNFKFSLGVNPVVTTDYGFLSDAIKKPNYEPFLVDVKSSMDVSGYYNNPNVLSENMNDIIKAAGKLNVNDFTVYDISKSYSYLDKNTVSKETMINTVVNEMNKLNVERINAHTPNDYLLEFVDSYYDTPYESSKYSFQTDSIPFVSILLSGYTDLFISNINYISNYDLMNLRMVEYNLYPSFVITSEQSFNLRYTNFEYLNSTEYNLWSSLIDETYDVINGALSNVSNSCITNHSYVAPGIAKVSYDNNVTIYVNYTNQNYITGNGDTVNGMNYFVEVK